MKNKESGAASDRIVISGNATVVLDGVNIAAAGGPAIKADPGVKATLVLKEGSKNTVAGASGYQIYQAKKSNGSYKLVKTITSQSTDTWKTKKLKKKKKYWYKVRAYRTVGGKKVYGSFSAVKYKKVK